MFRTNHASNYLPLGGDLPQDGPRIVALIDRALSGELGLRPEWARGLGCGGPPRGCGRCAPGPRSEHAA
ncbi:MAG: hypothetical protein ACK559_18420, partial [bacterium]